MKKEKTATTVSVGIYEDVQSEAEWLAERIQGWRLEQNFGIEIHFFENAE